MNVNDIIQRFDACRAMLETIRGEVMGEMSAECETGKSLYGVIALMEDGLEKLSLLADKEAAV